MNNRPSRRIGRIDEDEIVVAMRPEDVGALRGAYR
jgi:hypothetical protein